jgi:hypothetical protein
MSFHCLLPLSFQDKNIDADKSPKGAEVSGLLTRSSEWQIIGREHFQWVCPYGGRKGAMQNNFYLAREFIYLQFSR